MSKRNSYASFYALLGTMPGASKEELVLQWTGGRTRSLREMTDDEYNAMIRDLRRQVECLDDKRKARSAVLRQFQLYGIDTTDWDAVDRFCCIPRIAGKPFRYLTIPELKALRVKMLSIRNKAELKGYEQRRAALGAEITKGQLPN
ncbi:hypothetical protein [Porphyromonas bobii]|uniref:hypothetical protein n=1 Tax=Porphyromonas bobii TaxID=2811780 RepID=UPI001C00790E|nr:hypothetical protein [Porphyromonas bobii]